MPNNELTSLRSALAQFGSELRRNDATDELTLPWHVTLPWDFMLTEPERVEKGQRIFLDAMNKQTLNADTKLLLAQIFLRQAVPTHKLHQIKIDLCASELALLLRRLQIKRCQQLVIFLKTLRVGANFPESDYDGVLEWLETKKCFMSELEIIKEILLQSYCLNQYSFASAVTKLKELLVNQSVDTLIQNYKLSYWGAIREKSDNLIQIPQSFKPTIIPRDCLVKDETSNEGSAMNYLLITKLVADLEKLLGKLITTIADLEKKVAASTIRENQLFDAEQEQEHKKGVARIKKFHRYIDSISLPSNHLHPYFYNDKTINEEEKKQQVATVADLAYIIYKGVDPNGVCTWKPNSTSSYTESNYLLHYFLQNQQDKSKMKACIYAFQECEANSMVLFGNTLFASNKRRPLALENVPISVENTAVTPENPLSLDIIFKNPNKLVSLPTNSKVLGDLSPETKQEATTIFKQLQDYYVLALTRVNPDYSPKLPFLKQLECLVKSLFRSTMKQNTERLESVRLFINDTSLIFSANDTLALSQSLSDLKRHYHDRHKVAEHVFKSYLYKTMLKLIDVPISVIINQLPEEERIKFKIEENRLQLEEKMSNLEASLTKTDLKKEELTIQLKESELRREKDKVELAKRLKQSEVQREKDKVEVGEELNELRNLFFSLRPQTASHLTLNRNKFANADTSESHYVRF